jgi:hypothetical protein
MPPARIQAGSHREGFSLAANKSEWANSSNAPRIPSEVRLGYSVMISSIVIPAANHSKSNATAMRVSRTRGLPPRCSGSDTIQRINFSIGSESTISRSRAASDSRESTSDCSIALGRLPPIKFILSISAAGHHGDNVYVPLRPLSRRQLILSRRAPKLRLTRTNDQLTARLAA